MQKILRLLDLPPVWLLACMAIMWWLSQNLPILVWQSRTTTNAGWLIIVGAVLLTIASAIHFRKHRTSIIPRQEPSALVTSGPYRFSRNPIYLADALVLAGWTLILGALSTVAMIPVFIAIINRRFIAQEEQLLQQHFPSDFDAYRNTTRRWI